VKWLAVVLGAAALAVAGCGGGGGSADTGAADQKGAGPTRVEVIKSIGRPGAFDPARIYKAEAAGVVTVTSVYEASQEKALGTGFVIGRNGEIATNAHVVSLGRGAKRADEVYVQFEDGNQVPAKIIGTDPNADVALLKVDPNGLRLRVLPLGESRDVQVGAPVAAIGSPFDQPQSLSVGVISATDRDIPALTGFDIAGALQTDAAINHGNSGGPLVDSRGRVVGINSQIRSTGGGGEGVGFAVPADSARRSLDQLRQNGKANYAYLGVSTVPVYPQLGRHFGLGTSTGAWIQSVEGGGPAKGAGLRGGTGATRFQAERFATGGDVLVAVAGHEIRAPADVSAALSPLHPGQRVRVEYLRGGKRRSVQLTLKSRPSSGSDLLRP
jgi:S1-C subfamily serine protease